MTDLDRGLPSSPDAEKAILGAIILENELAAEAMRSLQPEHLYLDAHRRVYMAIWQVVADGKPVDTLTLAEELGRTKELEAVGGVAYLSSLTDGVPRRSSISHYIRIVLDKAQLRSLIHATNGIQAQALEARDSAKDILANAQDVLLDIKCGEVEDSKYIYEFAEERYAQTEAEFERTDQILGIPTGIEPLDKAMGGIRESEMLILAGRPGSGKTHSAIQATVKNAKSGRKIHWFSLEQKKGPLLDRIVQHVGHIPTALMRDKRMMPAEVREQFRNAQQFVYSQFGNLISIDDTRPLTTEQFLNRAVFKVKRDKIDLVVVDYAQLLVAKGKDEVERAIKQVQVITKLASDYVPVLCLAQLRRAPSSDANAIPTMQDLKGSSQYEQDAAAIALIHRPINKETRMRTGDDLMILDKMRDGEPDVFPVCMTKWADFVSRYTGSDMGQ